MDITAATQAVKDANAKLDKIKLESEATVQKVVDLELVIESMTNAGQTVPQELADAITALTAKVRSVDDVVQDAGDGSSPTT